MPANETGAYIGTSSSVHLHRYIFIASPFVRFGLLASVSINQEREQVRVYVYVTCVLHASSLPL